MDISENLSENNEIDNDRNRKREFLARAIQTLESAFSKVLSEDQRALYIERLCQLRPDYCAEAIARLVDSWKPEFGRTFPAIAEILDCAAVVQYEELSQSPIREVGRKFKSVSDIEPERCPKGWSKEDVFRAHLTQEQLRRDAHRPRPDADGSFPSWEALRSNAKVTNGEMAQWLEEGKDRQRECIGKLEDDPKWREIAQRLGAFPGLPGTRTESQVPVDPDERQAWATAKAKEQGLI